VCRPHIVGFSPGYPPCVSPGRPKYLSLSSGGQRAPKFHLSPALPLGGPPISPPALGGPTPPGGHSPPPPLGAPGAPRPQGSPPRGCLPSPQGPGAGFFWPDTPKCAHFCAGPPPFQPGFAVLTPPPGSPGVQSRLPPSATPPPRPRVPTFPAQTPTPRGPNPVFPNRGKRPEPPGCFALPAQGNPPFPQPAWVQKPRRFPAKAQPRFSLPGGPVPPFRPRPRRPPQPPGSQSHPTLPGKK